MATAGEFRAAADELLSIADELQSAERAVESAWNEQVVHGGSLARLINQALDVTHHNANAVHAWCDVLSTECIRRAGVCEAFQSELAAHGAAFDQYQADLDDWRERGETGRRPSHPGGPPSPPAPWVEVER